MHIRGYKELIWILELPFMELLSRNVELPTSGEQLNEVWFIHTAESFIALKKPDGQYIMCVCLPVVSLFPHLPNGEK